MSHRVSSFALTTTQNLGLSLCKASGPRVFLSQFRKSNFLTFISPTVTSFVRFPVYNRDNGTRNDTLPKARAGVPGAA